MRWGQKAQFLEETAEARAAMGLSTPSWDDRPQLREELVAVWNAWSQLNAQRRAGDGFSPHPIAFADLEAFFRLNGYGDATLVRDWTRWILLMDRAWMATVIEVNEAARPRGR